jgi:hypothetical protein
MRTLIGLVILFLPLAANAQAKHYGDISYAQPQDCSVITSQQPANPYAYLFRNYCERSDARLKQTVAKLYGRPQPSTTVLTAPAHGTPEAKRYGVACMGGLVMLRIKNGWEQALDADHRYYTCRDK